MGRSDTQPPPDDVDGGPTERIAAARDAWHARHADRLDTEPHEARTLSGIPVAPVYGPADTWPTEDYARKAGLPGEPPFTRGIRPGGYREGLWVMGQYSGAASPRATNERIRRLLASGQRGFSVALDLPTQNGLDSDHPLAEGEVGKVGVPIDTVEDMVDLLDGIPLADVHQIRTTANSIGPIAVALFSVAARRHGFAPADFKVMLQNDVLKEYVARGTQIFPPVPALRFAVDVIEYCARELPHWEPIEFCGYHLRDSGANAAQELAIALGNAMVYLDEAVSRGVDVDDFAGNLYLFLAAHQDLFEEVAKYRLARRLWHELLHGRYGARRESSGRLNLFVYTLGSPLTAQEPLNNVVRVAYQALAAALGGVQTLATSSYDEALGLPSDEAVHLSLRTQQILAHETGVTRTSDPLGGSWFLESLTDQLEQAVRALLDEIEREGGALAALESGWIAEQLETEAYRQQQAVERGERTVVGVNRFADEGQRPATLHADRVLRADPRVEEEQVARVRAARRGRDERHATRCLRELEQVARAGSNTVAPIITAVEASATVGEICSTLAGVWGRHDDPADAPTGTGG